MAELLESGLLLMAVGMGTVFVLLGVLVWVVHLMSRLSLWLGGPAAEAAGAPALRTAAPQSSASPEIVGAIGAALAMHRRKKGGRAALSKGVDEPGARQ